jgi:hypothetical protein
MSTRHDSLNLTINLLAIRGYARTSRTEGSDEAMAGNYSLSLTVGFGSATGSCFQLDQPTEFELLPYHWAAMLRTP